MSMGLGSLRASMRERVGSGSSPGVRKGFGGPCVAVARDDERIIIVDGRRRTTRVSLSPIR
jgi:hypothetical protein